jgi:non-heme chloroperoxidase
MKDQWISLITALACVATFTNPPPSARHCAAETSASFAGIWEGKMDGLPGIDLQIDEGDGKIGGRAILYFQVGGPWPLLAPRVDGKTFAFELQRHKCQGCEEAVSNNRFRMELTGANEANLWKVDDVGKNSGPEVKLVRRTEPESWRDPSPHRAQFVIVEYGVRIEVLDWGGPGRAVVLLAGSGNTAHVFDDFAPKLTSFCHVYAITRRGYGESSHPDAGYTNQRLAEDVVQVLDALKIASPVLVGHSAGGEELTRLGDKHSKRLAGLVFLDAAFDPDDLPASSPEYMALFYKLPAPMRTHAGPAAADLKSFSAYREWQVRNRDVAFPESELHNQFETNLDGSVGKGRSSSWIHNAIGEGDRKRDYSKIRVPVLAFSPAADDKRKYQPKDAQERAAMDAFDAATAAYTLRWRENLQHAASGVRTVDLQGANHYVFMSNEAEVLRELRAFVTGLR